MKSKTASYLSATAALATLGIGLACSPVFAAADDIVGTWLTGDGDGWIDGKIYDPNSGKTYKCVITIVAADTSKGFLAQTAENLH